MINIKFKHILSLFLLLSAIPPIVARQKADTTYTFRFVPQKDMFYVPLDGNDRELARLLECVRRNKDSILKRNVSSPGTMLPTVWTVWW